MKNYLQAAALSLLFAGTLFGQTPACGPSDLKCQLDAAMKALQADPKNPENYYNLGLIFQKSGAHKEAVESFSMYIAIPGLKPAFVADGHNNRGISHRAMRKPDLAVADYSKAIEFDPKNPRFYTNRANALLDLRKADEALADYQRSMDADPKFGLAYAGRGNYYVAANRPDEAIADLTKAIEYDPSNPEPYYTRAHAYRGKKEFAKMIPDLDKYIALNPGSKRYLADGYLNRGIAHAVTGNTAQAEKDLTVAIELAPTYADPYGARAMVYREMKKEAEAAADQKKFEQLRGTSKR